jgi:hypothetical protein
MQNRYFGASIASITPSSAIAPMAVPTGTSFAA